MDKNKPGRGAAKKKADSKKRAFLKLISKGRQIVRACEAVHIGRQTHYDWLDEDPVYAKLYEIAQNERNDVLEEEAFRRAVEGVEKPIVSKTGEIIGHRLEYSDILLIFLMKGAMPEKYKDRGTFQVEKTERKELKLTIEDKTQLSAVARELEKLGAFGKKERIQIDQIPDSNGNGNGGNGESDHGNGSQ